MRERAKIAQENYIDEVRESIMLYQDLKNLFTYEEIMWKMDMAEVMIIRDEYVKMENEKQKYIENMKVANNSSKQ